MEAYRLCEARLGVHFRDDLRLKIDIDSLYSVEVSNKGEVRVCDREGHEIAKLEETNRSFECVQLSYLQPILSIGFRILEEVDYYPHCDGEYDRYGHKWSTVYVAVFDENTKQLRVKE